MTKEPSIREQLKQFIGYWKIFGYDVDTNGVYFEHALKDFLEAYAKEQRENDIVAITKYLKARGLDDLEDRVLHSDLCEAIRNAPSPTEKQ